MKKRFGALLLAVMMVMGLALLAGCSKKPTLVGTWKLVSVIYEGQEEDDLGNDPVFYSFSEDGQLKAWSEDADSGEVLDEESGTYSFTENTLTLINTDGNKTECTYEISETTLTLTVTFDDGSTQTARFTRVQQKSSTPQADEKTTQPEESKQPEKKSDSVDLIGSWKVVGVSYDGQEEAPEGDPLYLTFSGDGQWASWYMVENGKATTEDNGGTYSTAGNTLTMYNQVGELQTDGTYKISGTTLTITATYDDGGTQTMRLTRAD